jgi:hypothetical protein
MGRRGKGGTLPKWHKGRLVYDDIGGFWHGTREGKLLKRRGLLTTKKFYDSLTDKERQEQVAQKMESRS